jgi:predicted dehydrogenase
MNKVKAGLIGCGAISKAYFEGCQTFENVAITACADLNPAAAQKSADTYKVRACTVAELLADPEIELVINLTIPAAHVPVNLSIIEAGKHIFSEKPVGISREEAAPVLALAAKKGLLIASAPDTFLGGPLQTCRKVIDDGLIGEPVAATAFMMSPGMETWHPNPGFFYARGGGPMFDMGPYYLTALVHLLGRMNRVTGSTRISFPRRHITSQPLAGTVIDVQVPTHQTGVIEFESGPIATVVMSFDIMAHKLHPLAVYGSKGTLIVPDPNNVTGEPLVRLVGEKEWNPVPASHPVNSHRGIGVADLAAAIRAARAPRASGELALHVVDAMQAFEESSNSGRHITLSTPCARPAPLPAGLAPGEIDF